jgi:adenosylcobinamide-GDP ribazoletransferase
VTRAGEPAAALAAVAFLTRLPVGRADFDGRAVTVAAPMFPVVGALLLLGASATLDASEGFAPPLLAAALAVAFLAVLTGALHLDALADTADALGGWSRDDRLRIMRDHSVGAFGASAISLTLLVEVAAVAALVEREAGIAVYAAVGAASRGIAPPLAALVPYARPEETGRAVAAAFTRRRSIAAFSIAALISVVAGVPGLAVLAAAVLIAALAGVLSRHYLGGMTGDSLGATIQLSETTGLVVAVALA